MKIKIGTRGSKLALYQANLVRDMLARHYSGLSAPIEIEIVTIKTSGDKILTASLSSFGGKGLFVKEIEEALFSGEIDMAVHSLKDVPQVIPDGLVIGAALKRDDPRDCVILKERPGILPSGSAPENLALILSSGAVVGTSSLRRRSLAARYTKNAIFEPLRGNIDTRLDKVKSGLFDAIILSSSGLIRLNMESRIDLYLDPVKFIPQCGQGVIAIEYASGRRDIAEIAAPLNDMDTYSAVCAERACIKELNCGCASPVGAYAYLNGEVLTIKGFVSNMEGDYLEKEASGVPGDCESIGQALAMNLIKDGALEILAKNN